MASTRDLDPRVQRHANAFIAYLERLGYTVTVTSTRRSVDTQRQLYSCYVRTGCSNCGRGGGCYPAAPPGHSQHDRGLAFDLHLDPPAYDVAGQLWERLGLTWGGRFSDPIHFDYRRRA